MTETWGEAILRIVRTSARPLSLSEIYREMECHPLVTAHHKEPWKDGVPNHHHAIRRRLTDLCRCGDVRRVGRGLYSSR